MAGIPAPTGKVHRKYFDNEIIRLNGKSSHEGNVLQLRLNLYFNRFGSFHFTRSDLNLLIRIFIFLARLVPARRFSFGHPSHGQRTRSHAKNPARLHSRLLRKDVMRYRGVSLRTRTGPQPLRS